MISIRECFSNSEISKGQIHVARIHQVIHNLELHAYTKETKKKKKINIASIRFEL